MNSIRQIFLALVSAAVLSIPARCDDSQEAKPRDIIESFKIAKNGNAIIVPVTISGKEYRFILDTGATTTVFDKTIPVGPLVEKKRLSTWAGIKKLPYHAAPKEVMVGSLPTKIEAVVVHDMTKLTRAYGEKIDGFLGMDFLRDYVIRINFDLGELQFLRSAPKDAGQSVPIKVMNGTPQIELFVDGLGATSFCLDTGYITTGTGSLSIIDFLSLKKSKKLRVVGQSRFTGVGVEGETNYFGQGAGIKLADFELNDLLFDEADQNFIGLGFISRFVIVLDFPKSALYLQEGKQFKRLDVSELCGLHVVRDKNQVIVESIDKGSVADEAGIKVGDIVVKIGEHGSTAIHLREFYRIRATPRAASIDVSARRSGLGCELDVEAMVDDETPHPGPMSHL